MTVTGEGLVRPENLRDGGFSSSSTTPQPIIQPGATFRVTIGSLNPQGSGIDNVFWTRPGRYQISASYPVYQNLPPHLPQLFPDQPQPSGRLKRYFVASQPITVEVILKDTATE